MRRMDSSAELLQDTDDGGLGFSNQPTRHFGHPTAAIFHILFRLVAVVVYLFCGFFTANFVVSFVVIVLLLSADFWTVKNVTGRLLVGLRWWNYIDQEGESHWVFESRKDEERNLISAADSRIFWLALFLSPLLWLVFLFVTIIGLNPKWFMVVCIGITLSGANLYGYLRCKIGQKQSLSTAAKGFLQQQVISNVMSSFSKSANAQTPTTNTV